MANAASASNNTGTLTLLDIVSNPESAAALKDMIDSSPGHTYIKPDLSDVNMLKVSIVDGNNDSIVTHLEVATNGNAAVYKRAMYGEVNDQSNA